MNEEDNEEEEVEAADKWKGKPDDYKSTTYDKADKLLLYCVDKPFLTWVYLRPIWLYYKMMFFFLCENIVFLWNLNQKTTIRPNSMNYWAG